MAQVVFLRGVNVGGHKKFQPSVLARELSDLGVVNIGAAGTFVVRGTISQAALRSRIRNLLAFDAEIIVCPARDIVTLLNSEPFLKIEADSGCRPFVTIMANAPRTRHQLPIRQPAGDKWEVSVIGISGRFALSLSRRMGKSILYPNEVVEKQFGVPATTRNWNTIVAIGKALAGS